MNCKVIEVRHMKIPEESFLVNLKKSVRSCKKKGDQNLVVYSCNNVNEK